MRPLRWVSCGLAVVLAGTVLAMSIHSGERERQLVWSDEFDGRAGALPSSSRWTFDIGTTADGWGSGQLQAYTRSPDNVSLDGRGHLDITVRDEVTSTEHGTRHYTSARITTRDRFTLQYGVVEARIRLPWTKGTWPAFWLLGADYADVGWPQCGEIDILEAIDTDGVARTNVHGAITGSHRSWQAHHDRDLDASADGWHVYKVHWDRTHVEFFVDGASIGRVSKSSMEPTWQWSFDRPFYVILNVAVGGGYPSQPDDTSAPATMTVDYVRAYQWV